MLERKYQFAIFAVIFLFISIGLILSNAWISRQLNDFPKSANSADLKTAQAAGKTSSKRPQNKRPGLIDPQDDPFAPVKKKENVRTKEEAPSEPVPSDQKIYEFSTQGPIFLQ